jgi:uncharacterized protein (DUF427 family)
VLDDTLTSWLVWESPGHPGYCVPRRHVRATVEETGRRGHSPSRGEATFYDVVVGGTVAEAVALVCAEPPSASFGT